LTVSSSLLKKQKDSSWGNDSETSPNFNEEMEDIDLYLEGMGNYKTAVIGYISGIK